MANKNTCIFSKDYYFCYCDFYNISMAGTGSVACT